MEVNGDNMWLWRQASAAVAVAAALAAAVVAGGYGGDPAEGGKEHFSVRSVTANIGWYVVSILHHVISILHGR